MFWKASWKGSFSFSIIIFVSLISFNKATGLFSTQFFQRKERHFDDDQPVKVNNGHSSCAITNLLYPHYCKGGQCSLSLSWRGHPEWVEFNLTAGKTRGEAVWVALGFSKDGKMADSDVIACGYYQHQGRLYNGWTSKIGRSCHIEPYNKSVIRFHSVNYGNGVLSCSFSKRKLNMTAATSAAGWGNSKPITQNWHILLAWGQLDLSSSGGVGMNQHAEKFSTPCTCNVTDCSQTCSCANQLKKLLLKLHGSIMIIVFVFLLPLAAIIGRHYRSVFPDSWFKSHMSLMSMGILGMLMGLGFILGHTGGTFSIGFHQIFGIVTIGLGVIQGTAAMVRPNAGKSLKRKLFEIFHRINAILILLLGTVTMFWGAWYLHHNHKKLLLWMESLMGFSVFLSLSAFLLLEIINKVQSCQVNRPLVKYSKLSHPSGSDVSEEENEVYVKEDHPNTSTVPYFREKVIILLFILQSFTFTGLLSAFTFYEI